MQYTSNLPLPEIRNVTLSSALRTTETCGVEFTLRKPLRTSGTEVTGVAAGTVVGVGATVVGVGATVVGVGATTGETLATGASTTPRVPPVVAGEAEPI